MKLYLLLPLGAELGLWQADLPAAPWVNLGATSITSPVTSHSVPTKHSSVSVLLTLVRTPVLPPVRPPVVLTLGHQDADHSQEECLGFSRFKLLFCWWSWQKKSLQKGEVTQIQMYLFKKKITLMGWLGDVTV